MSYSICFNELTPEEFFGWIQTRGFDVPTFWRMTEPPSGHAVALKREGTDKEERKLTAKPSLKSDLSAAYKERIKSYCGKKPPSRADDEQWIRKHFDLSVTRARDLRRELAPPHWRKPGRRKCKD